MMKHKVIELLKQAQLEGERFYERLSPAERNTIGTPEQWSARDMIAHVAEWERHLVARCIEPRAHIGADPYQREIDQVNADIFEAYRNRTWEEVRSIFKQAHTDAERFIHSLTEEELCDTQRYDWMEGKPTWRWFLGTFYIHAFGHYEAFYIKGGETAEAHRLKETAAASLLTVSDTDEWRALVTYNLACIDAIAGQKDKALERLKEALRLNPSLKEWSRQDPDLISLHGDLGYEGLY
jgi:hypothetical protein